MTLEYCHFRLFLHYHGSLLERQLYVDAWGCVWHVGVGSWLPGQQLHPRTAKLAIAMYIDKSIIMWSEEFTCSGSQYVVKMIFIHDTTTPSKADTNTIGACRPGLFWIMHTHITRTRRKDTWSPAYNICVHWRTYSVQCSDKYAFRNCTSNVA